MSNLLHFVADLTDAGEALSRRKSFKKTLRESFRRLRRGRSTRNNAGATTTPITETRPVERQIEARPADDAMGSMVRCLTLAQTFISNGNHWPCFLIRDSRFQINFLFSSISLQFTQRFQLSGRQPIPATLPYSSFTFRRNQLTTRPPNNAK